MPDRPFHHGNLRAALLTEAERTLRKHSIDALSLRDLARQVGVSHGAPRRHFADRQALLDALAELGFTRLNDEIRAAVSGAGPDYLARLRAASAAYVRFAANEAALLDLMFTAKNTEPPPSLQEAAQRFFVTVGDLITQGQQGGNLYPGDLENLRLLLVATLQGIAALLVSGRLPAEKTEALVTDAVALFAAHTSRPGAP